MIQSKTELDVLRNLREALDKSVEAANSMHLSEQQLKNLLEERWEITSHNGKSPNTQSNNEYFNGLAGP